MAPNSTLIAMPSEVIIEIYMNLLAFRDVFALSGVCRRLSDIWRENATPIYRALAPYNIGFLKPARQLLADQGGAPTNSDTLTVHDVRRMIRNAHRAEKAADIFGQEVVPRVPSCGFYYTPPQPRAYHPPGLTRTEYPRFIHAYYRVSSLLELGPSLWKDRYESFTLRQLYRAYEMLHLNYPLGEEIFPHGKTGLPDTFEGTSDNRRALYSELYQFQFDERRRIHGEYVSLVHFPTWGRNPTEYGGVDGFITIWDHFHQEFHGQVVGDFNPSNTPRPYDEYMKEEIWGESSDEETYRRKYRTRRQRRQQS
ncbi:hypothetical protein F4802DRAFT_614048 [Xylaria palmicola]|nr:hypothetical protein F4802DRAFT_614048 [Xylaria palmicola]